MADGGAYTPPATLAELFEKTLLPLMLKYGVSFDDFWNMTIKEMNISIKVFQEQEKSSYEKVYIQASLVANFVGHILNGTPIPPIHQVFPEYYIEENNAARQAQEYKAAMLYKEQMLDWAYAVNKKRKKANQDGENNK